MQRTSFTAFPLKLGSGGKQRLWIRRRRIEASVFIDRDGSGAISFNVDGECVAMAFVDTSDDVVAFALDLMDRIERFGG